MADAKYDAIIIGGGNKGLVTAMYLAKYGGMKTAVFEIRHEVGGGWSAEETAAPGFVANTHSTVHYTFYHDLLWEDIPEFQDRGGTLVYPKGAWGTIFKEDDSCLVQYNDWFDPSWEKTAQSVARFSKKDAETYLKFGKIWDEFLYPEFHRWYWTPALSCQPDPFFQKIITEGPKFGIDPLWMSKTLMQVCSELFESNEIRCALCRASYSWSGAPAHIQGSGFAILFCFSWRETAFVRGGSHSLAHAAQKIIVENGGKVFTRQGVDKVIIENGKARGIRLLDGSEVESKLVVSTLSPQLLCLKLIGEEHISQTIIGKIKSLCDFISPSVWWASWALCEQPKYKAASFDPGIDDCGFVALADRDIWGSSKEFWRRKLGREYPTAPIIEGLPLTWVPSVIDKTYAPPGKISIGTELYTCAADQFSEKEWVKYEKDHAESLVKEWSTYGTNINWDNIIGYHVCSPWDITYRLPHTPTKGTWPIVDAVACHLGWNRPIPELAGHRTPIEGLYGAGSGWHPVAGAHSSGGYNCYKVLAEDYGLRKPWEEKGRSY